MIAVATALDERLKDAHAAGAHWVTTEGLVALAERHEQYHPTPGAVLRLRMAHGLAHKALDRFCDAVRLAECAGLPLAEADALMLEYQAQVGRDDPAVGYDMAPGLSFPGGGAAC